MNTFLITYYKQVLEVAGWNLFGYQIVHGSGGSCSIPGLEV
jgi:hypothetical protein